MYVRTGEGAAWRAIYVYGGRKGRDSGPMRFSIGIDPTKTHNRAELFGSIGFRKDCTGGRRAAWHWRLPLWRARYWWRLDGRRSYYAGMRK